MELSLKKQARPLLLTNKKSMQVVVNLIIALFLESNYARELNYVSLQCVETIMHDDLIVVKDTRQEIL